MQEVVLASLPGENQTVAIKCIPKKEVTTSLLRESRILQQVRGSPFICHAYAGLQSESHAYFVMEHLPGGSLGSLIEQRECLPDHLVEFYTAELVCGIQFLHERGIAHRDLKPDNIMLDEDGHVKIIDLGLAQDQLTGGRTISGRCGTPDYMAPEILMGVGRMIARRTAFIGRRRCEGHRCFVRFSWASLMELPWIGGPSASPWQKC
ncbi:protein kinase C delta type-like isoform X6 [Hyperolius riggenbachi]|uniref:protein kinase C delta type-like isoform X6 n=1 Tax=Hyperolius riggenbachi TaxID=752182 RepID=UPI0035A2A023